MATLPTVVVRWPGGGRPRSRRRYHQPGSNGLTFDPEGRLTICQHGNRRVIRVNPHGDTTGLAGGYDARRLNSPNDLVYRSDGTLYFTDPPFGLPGAYDDPDKELPFSGVFRARDGEVLYDMTAEDALDGIKVDQDGNLYVCGPGGIWILSAEGEKLGIFQLPEEPHNLARGDADARSLYVTA